jgi:hypothetical protein
MLWKSLLKPWRSPYYNQVGCLPRRWPIKNLRKKMNTLNKSGFQIIPRENHSKKKRSSDNKGEKLRALGIYLNIFWIRVRIIFVKILGMKILLDIESDNLKPSVVK